MHGKHAHIAVKTVLENLQFGIDLGSNIVRQFPVSANADAAILT